MVNADSWQLLKKVAFSRHRNYKDYIEYPVKNSLKDKAG